MTPERDAALRAFHKAIEALTDATGLYPVCVFVEFEDGKGRVFSTGSPFKPEDTVKILNIA